MVFFCFGIWQWGKPQEDLETLIAEPTTSQPQPVIATFKTTRVVNGHSIEMVPDGELIFFIHHRFGNVDQGIYSLFGLEQATVRLGLEYGWLPWLTTGIGRSSYNKTYDTFLKIRLLRQYEKGFPFSCVLFSNVTVTTLRDKVLKADFSRRLAFTHQVLLARKFSRSISFQLMPTLIHYNLVNGAQDQNTLLAMGIGGRFKITNRVALNYEYYYLLPDQIHSYSPANAAGLSLDIETGGHVFQILFTNTQAMFEPAFITDNHLKEDDPLRIGKNWFLGFNISRIFTIKGSGKQW
jgi:hypothetical protein